MLWVPKVGTASSRRLVSDLALSSHLGNELLCAMLYCSVVGLVWNSGAMRLAGTSARIDRDVLQLGDSRSGFPRR